MKRPLISFTVACAFLIAGLIPSIISTGCHTPTQQKLSVTTIVSTHQVVDAALDTYLDLVVAKKLATNGVPAVLTSYALYQQAYNSALVVVLGNTNAPAPPELAAAAASFTTTVNNAKKGGL